MMYISDKKLTITEWINNFSDDVMSVQKGQQWIIEWICISDNVGQWHKG